MQLWIVDPSGQMMGRRATGVEEHVRSAINESI